MKNIFRLICLMLAVFVLAGVFSGCGEKTEESASESEEIAEEASEEVSEEPVTLSVSSEDAIESVTLIVNDDDTVEAVAVEYNTEIDEESITASDYTVTSSDGSLEYAVTAIYTNNEPAMAEESAEGCYVILELSENASDAMAESEDEAMLPDIDGDVIYGEDNGAEAPGDDVQIDETAPKSPEDEAEDEGEVTAVGPDGLDPEAAAIADAEAIVGSSPDEVDSAEPKETEETDEDTVDILIVQNQTILAADGTEISPSPAQYNADAIVNTD